MAIHANRAAFKLNGVKVFVYMPVRRNCHGESLFAWLQSRFMTTSKRVRDRSSMKRVQDLEIVTEKMKITSKVLAILEILQEEPEMIIPVRNLDQYRNKLNLPKPHKVSDFLQKSPKIFDLYKDQRGLLWCGMTKAGEDLVQEQERIIEEYSDKTAEYVTRCLMMSANRRLRLDKIANLRRDFGLPLNFRKKWVHMYPELFKVVSVHGDEVGYLELVSWNPDWAVTELEKKVTGATEIKDHKPGLLTSAFPLKFPLNYKKVYRYGGKIEHFQKMPYLSPYADATGLTAGSREFDKRAIAIMHELLSFTIEKRLVTDHLTHFRREFVMPQKLMRLLLKHFGIFYVSERGKRFSVFLTEAYERQELVEKCPLVIWKEKLLSLIGYRGKKKKIETFSDFSDVEEDSIDIHSESENTSLRFEQEHIMDSFEENEIVDNDEMEIGEIGSVYKDNDT